MSDNQSSHSYEKKKQQILTEVAVVNKEIDDQYFEILQKSLSDVGNSERLIRYAGDELRFVAEQKSWFIWNRKYWQKDINETVVKKAVGMLKFLKIKASYDYWDSLKKFIIRSESKQAIDNMITLSRPKLTISYKDCDVDPWLVNLENGTIDLRTGMLRDHAPSDLITKICPVIFNSSARCPTWLQFLNRITAGNASVAAFLQKAVGYALTGIATEQVLFLFYGTGANGKTTFLETIRCLLGKYAIQADFSSFLEMRSDAIRNDRARLMGARFVAANESNPGRNLDEAFIKTATGGEPVVARFLHQEFFEYLPQYKLFLAANRKPKIQGTDEGIWRRIRVVTFREAIPISEQDKNFLDRLKAEFPGILNWALEGCRQWQNEGLGMPPEVAIETSSYRDEQDVIGRFLDECCERNETALTSASTLYGRYRSWCDESGEKFLSKAQFGTILKERCLEPKRINKQRQWKGVQLLKRGNFIEADSSDV